MHVFDLHQPTLSLVYLPHLDYALQKLGPDAPGIAGHVKDIDAVVGNLIDYFQQRNVRIILLSEYGIEPVHAVIEINRVLRREGLLDVRVEDELELLDAGASRAFAVADHQIAHVYVNTSTSIDTVAQLCAATEGVERVLDHAAQAQLGIKHVRSGDLVLVAKPGHWFSYQYWLDDRHAPDFARTVDIHRKPGYDPLELFIDPRLQFPRLRIARKLLMKKLGFHTLLNVIPLDNTLLRGSHGRTDLPDELMPVLAHQLPVKDGVSEMSCTDVRHLILGHLFDDHD